MTIIRDGYTSCHGARTVPRRPMKLGSVRLAACTSDHEYSDTNKTE
jgi:hypothetical protein